MNTKFRLSIVAITLISLMLPAGKAFAADSTEYVKTPVALEAKDILPAKLLQEKNYAIENQVQNDGLINTYRLATDYGPLKAESTAELMIRIGELTAMSAMEEMDQKKVFGDAVLAGVKAPIQGAVNLIQAPVKTTTNVVKGAGRFFSNIGRSIVSDDPHQDNVFKVALGYDASKRAFAYELGINPYSSYEPGMAMLGRISQASVAGGIAPRAAMSAIGGGVAAVASATGTAEQMRKLVRDNPPGELEKINASKLAGMGISQSLAEAFLNNYAYDPQEKTLLIGELERLGNVKGREEFIAAAGLVSQHSVALLYRTMAWMMAGYHSRVSPVQSIGRLSGTPYLRKKDKSAVLLLPLDFIFRTVEVEAKLNKLDDALKKAGGASGKELWITGRVDESAGKMLETSGWKVVEGAGGRL